MRDLSVERILLPTPFPVGGVNAYYLPGPEPTLVDTGTRTPEARAALEKALQGRPVAKVVVTHGHVDHFGLAGHLRAQGARLSVHEADVPSVEGFDRRAAARRASHEAGLRRAGVPPAEVDRLVHDAARYDAWAEATPVDAPLGDGDALRMGRATYRILHAPGHTRGSMLLVADDASHTFTGDTVLEHITPNALSVRHEDAAALPTYLATLRRLLATDLGQLLPGHGDAFHDHRASIRRALGHAQRRQERILGHVTASPASPHELTRALFRRIRSDQLFLALSEVLGHLSDLERQGRVAADTSDGVRRYRAVGG